MASAKHYRSFRLYLDDSPEKVPAAIDTDSDILHFTHNMGGDKLGIKTRRECFADSKLLVRSGSHSNYRVNYQEMVGAMIFAGAIYLNTGNWKADVLFMAAFVLLVIKGVKMLMPWLRNYWRDDTSV